MGSRCRLSQNEFGECAYFNQCPAAQQMQSLNQRLFFCGQQFGAYIVCCPIQRNVWQTSMSSQWPAFPGFHQQQPFVGFQQPATNPQVMQNFSQHDPSTTSSTVRTPAYSTSTRSSKFYWPGSTSRTPTSRPVASKSTRISEQSKLYQFIPYHTKSTLSP